MAIREIELQKAVYTALNTGQYAVADVPPIEPVLPLITLSDIAVVTDDTKTTDRTVHRLQVNAWSKSHSKVEVLTMMEFIKVKLVDTAFTVTGFNVDNVVLVMKETFRDANYAGAVFADIDGIVQHGVIQLDVVLSE